MLDLHDREWLAIPLSSVFSIKSTSSGIDKNKLIYQSGKYPYVTRTTQTMESTISYVNNLFMVWIQVIVLLLD